MVLLQKVLPTNEQDEIIPWGLGPFFGYFQYANEFKSLKHHEYAYQSWILRSQFQWSIENLPFHPLNSNMSNKSLCIINLLMSYDN